MPGPLVQALIAHFDSVFEGPNGDYPAVLEALAIAYSVCGPKTKRLSTNSSLILPPR